MSRSAGAALPENSKNKVFGRRDYDLDLQGRSSTTWMLK
jgi:hypothetical protein